MNSSVNKVIIIGNIGSETAEVRQVGQNVVAKFSVATSERWRKPDGTNGEETTWHRVELWGNAGVHPYLVKGQPVYIEGAYKCNDWVDQQGNKRRDYFIKAFTVQLLGQRQQQASPAPAPQAPGYAPAPGYQAQPHYQQPPQYGGQPAPPAPPVAPMTPPTPPAAPVDDLPWG